MKEWILNGYEFLTELLPFLAVLLLVRRHCKKSGRAMTCGHVLLVVVFAVYIVGVFYFTGVGTLADSLLYGLDLRGKQINLHPFSATIDATGYLLNVILFVPLGFLLPLICRGLDRLHTALLAGVLLSLLIECSQLLNTRATDIDDVVLNTAGALIGFGIYRLFARRTKQKSAASVYCKHEAALYVAAMFAGRFLFYNELKMAGWLYGF